MRTRARTIGTTAAVLVLVVSLAVPAGAKSKPKPKPDRTPPHSTITTPDGSVKIGVDTDMPPDAVRPVTVVEGISRDNKGGKIAYVAVRFSREFPGLGTLGEIDVDLCEPAARVCHWSARVPWLDPDYIQADPANGVAHGVPGQWTVQAKAVDLAGNLETNGPTITIVVI